MWSQMRAYAERLATMEAAVPCRSLRERPCPPLPFLEVARSFGRAGTSTLVDVARSLSSLRAFRLWGAHCVYSVNERECVRPGDRNKLHTRRRIQSMTQSRGVTVCRNTHRQLAAGEATGRVRCEFERCFGDQTGLVEIFLQDPRGMRCPDRENLGLTLPRLGPTIAALTHCMRKSARPAAGIGVTGTWNTKSPPA